MENMNYIPNLLPENIGFIKSSENKVEYIIANKYTELKRIKINDVSEFILKSIDGKRTITEITELIKSNFSGAQENEVKKDVMMFLFSCWRLELIDWVGESPYSKQYSKQIGNYSCEILTGKKACEIIDELHKANKITYSLKMNSNVQINEENIRKRIFYGLANYCSITFNDKNIMIYEISIKSKKRRSIDFSIYYSEDLSKYELEKIEELIKWSVKIYGLANKVSYLRVDTTLDSKCDLLLEKNLYNLKFDKVGVLKKHLIVDNNVLDVNLYSKNL